MFRYELRFNVSMFQSLSPSLYSVNSYAGVQFTLEVNTLISTVVVPHTDTDTGTDTGTDSFYCFHEHCTKVSLENPL